MTKWCKHVHWLELKKFLNFSTAYSPVRLDVEMKVPYFLFLTWLSKIKNQEFIYLKLMIPSAILDGARNTSEDL